MHFNISLCPGIHVVYFSGITNSLIFDIFHCRVVPRLEHGLLTTPCHGDQGSHERMTDAKRARNAHDTEFQRLDGLEQVPQEFHHRGVMLQVIKPECFNEMLQ